MFPTVEVEAEGRHDDTGFYCARKGRRWSVLVPQPTDSLTKVEKATDDYI